MSSTDVISLQDESGEEKEQSQYEPSGDVLDDIEALLEDIPALGKTFSLLDKIGEGTFSSVYLAQVKQNLKIKHKFALKHIIPTSHPKRIERELRCLKEIGGQDNVIGVKACLREKDHVVIVMPYFHHDKFQDYVYDMCWRESRDYIKNLLVSLKRVHSKNIIHRDVKPSNFLYDRKEKMYALVDFGLAQEYIPPTRGSAQGLRSSKRREKGDLENALSPKKRRTESQSNNTDQAGYKANILSNIHNQLEDHISSKACTKDSKAPDVIKNKFVKSTSPREALLPKRVIDISKCSSSGRKQVSRTPTGAAKCVQKQTAMVMKDGRQVYASLPTSMCKCYGKPSVCSLCIAKNVQAAARAGTPGFRAPEVLLKCPDQTTAIDIWAAGVIFLSILSGRYPFFKAPDDLNALAQIMCIRGSEEVMMAAEAQGKKVTFSENFPKRNSRTLCRQLREAYQKLRERKSGVRKQVELKGWEDVPDSAYDLLDRLLDPNPCTRITAEEAILHPFFIVED